MIFEILGGKKGYTLSSQTAETISLLLPRINKKAAINIVHGGLLAGAISLIDKRTRPISIIILTLFAIFWILGGFKDD